MNILILGGNGFIGINLVRKLLLKGHNITVFGRRNIRCTNQVKYVEGEFDNIQNYHDVFNNIDIVYHLISTTVPQTSNLNFIYDIQSNVIKTIELLHICVKKGVKKFIYISSGGTVYGVPQRYPISELHETNPICSYGITKIMVEKYLAIFYSKFNLEYTIVRLSNPYGPWQKSEKSQGVIGMFIRKILTHEPITIWGDGSVIRDYIFIDDAVEAMTIFAERRFKSNVFNLGSGVGVSLNELIGILQEQINQNIVVEYQQKRSFDIPINILDISRIEQELDWHCKFDLRGGIEKTLQWWRTQNI